MRLLLDTQAFLWWITADRPLGRRALPAVRDPANECLLSLASVWEIAIKSSLGKIDLGEPVERFVPEQLRVNGFAQLGIEFRHAARVATLPFHHRDPFDRLIVAQALEQDLAVVSADRVLGRYGVERIW